MNTRFLHVTSGSCTTSALQAAGVGGIVSVWADPLYNGPVSAELDDEQLIDVRAEHLARGHRAEPVSVAQDLRRWRRVIEDVEAYDELVLWFEHDLFDQLNLVQLLSWLPVHIRRAKPIALITLHAFPGHPHFKGLGELAPQELASLLPGRQPVESGHHRLAEQAWRAFRSPDPTALARLRGLDTGALPYLADALTRFLEEYPWTRDGLSRTERRLLQLAAPGDVRVRDAFAAMHEGERSYFVTDATVLSIVEALSRSAPPLLEHAPSPSASDPLAGTIGLTALGDAVLKGREDRVQTCGIDRWFGGVQLQGHDVWRWDAQTAALVRPAR